MLIEIINLLIETRGIQTKSEEVKIARGKYLYVDTLSGIARKIKRKLNNIE